MKTVGVVTVGRSDYGIYYPILRKIEEHTDLELHLYVSGMHLSPEFGMTVNMIEEDEFPIWERVEMLLSSDTPEGIGKSMGLGVVGFAQVFARSRPDLLVVLGDRFEMHSAALAALPFNIPVAHIHGGEITEGAIDDSLRHSLTKLSHLHFVTTEEYRRRVMQLGEESWRIVNAGALSLDNLDQTQLATREELEERLHLSFDSDPLLVTYHPVTLEYEETEWQVRELLGALRGWNKPLVFTLPNADTAGRQITQLIEEFASHQQDAILVDNLGTRLYFSMMAISAVMIGNSSSGLIEAPAFHLPVVNIGTRQKGRIRSPNVIDVGHTSEEIQSGIRKAFDLGFRQQIQGIVNPYKRGSAAKIIVTSLKQLLDGRKKLTPKKFADHPVMDQGEAA